MKLTSNPDFGNNFARSTQLITSHSYMIFPVKIDQWDYTAKDPAPYAAASGVSILITGRRGLAIGPGADLTGARPTMTIWHQYNLTGRLCQLGHEE